MSCDGGGEQNGAAPLAKEGWGVATVAAAVYVGQARPEKHVCALAPISLVQQRATRLDALTTADVDAGWGTGAATSGGSHKGSEGERQSHVSPVPLAQAGSSGDHGAGSGAGKPCGCRWSSRGSTSEREGLPPTHPRRSSRSRTTRPSARTGLDTADAGDGQSEETNAAALLDLGRALGGPTAVAEGGGVTRFSTPAPRVSRRAVGRPNYAVLNGSPNRAAIAAAAADEAAAAAAPAPATPAPAAAPAPARRSRRADPAAGGSRQSRARAHKPYAAMIAGKAAANLQQQQEEQEQEEQEQEEEEEEEEEEEKDAAEDEDEEEGCEEDDDEEEDSEDDEEDPIEQDKTQWAYCNEEKEANFEVLIKLRDVIHSKEFAYKNGRGNDHWYTRVAHLIVKRLKKNKTYMKAHGHDYEARYGRNEMKHLREWVSSQKRQYNKHLRRRGTGGSGGKLPPAKGLTRYRHELFSTNAASSKKKFMKETFVNSSGIALNLNQEGASRGLASAGGGGSGSDGVAEEVRQDSELKPMKREGQGKGKGKGKDKIKSKSKGKGKGKARQDGGSGDLDKGADDSGWSATSSESERLSDAGGLSDGVEVISDEELEEVSPPDERKRKRKSSRFSPQKIFDTLQQIADAKAERQEATLIKVAGLFSGGMGAGGSSGGVGGSSSSPPDAQELRRMEVQGRRISRLEAAWKNAQVANENGYGSMEDVQAAYEAYKKAAKEV